MTARASFGEGEAAFSSIRRVSSSWSRLPQLTPMRTGLPYLERQLDDLGELAVALGLEADVARIDAVLVEGLGAGGILGEQRVAVVMEVADQRHGRAHRRQPVADMRHGLGGLVAVDRDAHDLRARAGKLGRLPRGRLHVGRVSVGHRLHDDRRLAADRDAADIDGN